MMCIPKSAIRLMVAAGIILSGAMLPSSPSAHCDTMDGPVVKEAKAALEKGDVTRVLKWVAKENEDEIKAVFAKVLAARRTGPEAKEVADRYFLETLIRLHRAGEGEPFTGLKPAGAIEPAVAAADRAIGTGSVDELAREVGQAARHAVTERFERLMNVRKHKDENVAAGRAYVAAYVEYVHFVEMLHAAIAAGEPHHGHTK